MRRGDPEQPAADLLQGLRRHGLDGRGQSGFRRVGVAPAEPTEAAVGSRVRQMEGEGPIAEAVHLLEHKGPQHLLAAQPGAAPRLPVAVPRRHEVLLHRGGGRRIFGEKSAHRRQLLGRLGAEPGVGEARLTSQFSAHSAGLLLAKFLAKSFGISGFSTLILLDFSKKSQPDAPLNSF